MRRRLLCGQHLRAEPCLHPYVVPQPRATTEKQRTERAHFDLRTHSSYHFHSVLGWILLRRGCNCMHRCCIATKFLSHHIRYTKRKLHVTILRVSQSSTACAAGTITQSQALSSCSRTLVSHNPPIISSCAVGTLADGAIIYIMAFDCCAQNARLALTNPRPACHRASVREAAPSTGC